MPSTRFLLCNDPRNWTKKLHRKPGIYKLLVLGKDGKPKRLSRVGGVDSTGLLYIGQHQRVRDRLRAIRRKLCEGNKKIGPMPAETYCASQKWRTIAPPMQLAYQFKHCDKPCKEEARLLKRYFSKFGEVPPLNGRAEFITSRWRRKRSVTAPEIADTRRRKNRTDSPPRSRAHRRAS